MSGTVIATVCGYYPFDFGMSGKKHKNNNRNNKAGSPRIPRIPPDPPGGSADPRLRCFVLQHFGVLGDSYN